MMDVMAMKVLKFRERERKREKEKEREREGKRNEFVARDTKLKNLGSRDKTASETIQISRRARKIRSRS